MATQVPFRPLATDLRLGILGGGQLAQMLGEAAQRLGFCPVIYAERSDDPATFFTRDVVVGSWDDSTALAEFLARVDVVVFENEFIDGALLGRLAEKQNHEIHFFPSLQAIETIRDKAQQKAVLKDLQIPTAPHLLFPADGTPDTWIASALRTFGGACVLKFGRLGYDGKGVLIVDNSAASLAEAEAFVKAAIARQVSLYAEPRVRFRRELAIIGCRGRDGSFVAYPVVVSEQEGTVCRRVYGPATALGLPPERARQAQAFAQHLAKAQKLVGCFALELFETEAGELWVNEIAPRVHNSGHYTQDAAVGSQFENHWRAVLGLPLASTKTAPAFAMVNLLGVARRSVESAPVLLPVPNADQYLHWYGKKLFRAGRKLGHLNGVGETAAALPVVLEAIDACRRAWEKKISEN